ncbi:SpaA isopeptide-forming pilin-related protein [Paenibacillaceae bacterium WGS1546]|uniref:SpaA isopeptide-forming pilin-related protein n=1 Tax=Cohnella sp. WGS1546 TaxID=3366810 RepID=UPI00372D822D
MKKLSFLLIALVLLLNVVSPSSLVRGEGASVTESVYGDPVAGLLNVAGNEITENLITGVKMYDAEPVELSDGTVQPQGNEIQDIRPNIGNRVAVVYQWSLPDDSHPYDNGSTYTFHLPDELDIPHEMDGNLTGGVGQYVVKMDKSVVFTFNESILGTQLNGSFYVWVHFDQSEFGDGLEHVIDFSYYGQGVIPVHFANTAEDGLEKSGSANRNNFNSDEIVWTVDFNQGENLIENPVFSDTFLNGQELKGDVTICKLVVQVDGSVKALEDTCETAVITSTANGFELPLGSSISEAYRLIYKTSVAAPTTGTTPEDFQNVLFENEAKLIGTNNVDQSDIGSVRISFNEPLNKSSTDYTASEQTIAWKVEFNYNQQTIPAEKAWIQDRFDVEKWELLHDSVRVSSVAIDDNGNAGARTPVDSDKYEVIDTATGFQLKFADEISGAYDILYETKAKNRVYEDARIINEVTIESGMKKGSHQDISEVIFDKRVKRNGENFQDKTITWELVLNEDEKDMWDIVITENYAGRHMTLIPDSFEVDGPHAEEFEIEALPGDSEYESGFLIKLAAGVTIEKKHVITFTTEFNPRAGIPPGNQYLNTAILEWTDDNGEHDDLEKTASVTAQDYTIKNGRKEGKYNAQDKTITWTIDVNYNLHKIDDAIIRDSYTGNQEFVENSLKVYHLVLNTGNNSVSEGEPVDSSEYDFKPNEDGKGFELKLGEIGSAAYRVEYKTRLGVNSPITRAYSNQATLHDGGQQRFSDSVEVTPVHGGEYVYKTGQQVDRSDKATWRVTLNPSQSYIAAGSVVTDTLSDNQNLMPDTIKLYETNIPADNSRNIYRGHELDESKYNLVVNGNTYTITFHIELTTAYILEYESFIIANSGDRIENKVEFAGHSVAVIGEDNQAGIVVSLAGAGGGASTGVGKLKIVKKDDLNQPLEGVVFELRNASGTTLLETLVTDENGEATTSRNYKYNDQTDGFPYKLKEVSAPDGYLIDPEYAIGTGKDIFFKDPEISIEITNKIIRQGFELTKVDSANSTKKLEGAVFELRDSNGRPVGDLLTTSAEGRIGASDLDPGTYTLVEITPPLYYELDDTPIPITIEANQTEIVRITQPNVLGSGATLTVIKVDFADHDKPLQGVEFELLDSNRNSVDLDTTDINGMIKFEGLPYGKYTLVEHKAEGYVIEQAEREVSVDRPNQEVFIENKKNDRSVKLTKYNANKTYLLRGAIFELREKTLATDLQGNPIFEVVPGIDVSLLTTNEDGEIYLEDLPPNTYQLVETKAPSGYRLDRTPIEFEITNVQTETVLVEKTNARLSGGGGGGGDGGGGVEKPVEPEEPVNPDETEEPEQPEEPVEPGETEEPGNPVEPEEPGETEQPNNPDKKIEEETTVDKPVDGKVEVPEGGKVEVIEGPEHGTVEITPDGKWKYTPNEGYEGKDSFKLKITDPNGIVEEVLVEIDIDGVPRGGVDAVKTPGKTLPKTGESSSLPMQLAGLALIGAGLAFLIRQRLHRSKA